MRSEHSRDGRGRCSTRPEHGRGGRGMGRGSGAARSGGGRGRDWGRTTAAGGGVVAARVYVCVCVDVKCACVSGVVAGANGGVGCRVPQILARNKVGIMLCAGSRAHDKV